MATTKRVDFHNAGKRHFTDAELLFTLSREASAGHLYGFAAECGIKTLLVWKDYPTDPDTGELVEKGHKKKFRTHIHALVKNINTLRAFLDGRGAAKYLAMLPNLDNFSDWNIDHRYYADTALPSSLLKWREAAREIMRMLDEAMLDRGKT